MLQECPHFNGLKVQLVSKTNIKYKHSEVYGLFECLNDEGFH